MTPIYDADQNTLATCNRKHRSSKGRRETQKHHGTLLTGRKHPNAARKIKLEAEATSLALRGPCTANLRLSMSSTGAPVSLTLGRQPTTSCYIIRLLPTADDPLLEALQLKLPHSSTDLWVLIFQCSIGAAAAPISLSVALGAPARGDPDCFTAAVHLTELLMI